MCGCAVAHTQRKFLLAAHREIFSSSNTLLSPLATDRSSLPAAGTRADSNTAAVPPLDAVATQVDGERPLSSRSHKSVQSDAEPTEEAALRSLAQSQATSSQVHSPLPPSSPMVSSPKPVPSPKQLQSPPPVASPQQVASPISSHRGSARSSVSSVVSHKSAASTHSVRSQKAIESPAHTPKPPTSPK